MQLTDLNESVENSNKFKLRSQFGCFIESAPAEATFKKKKSEKAKS